MKSVQIERRRQRAREENFNVENLGDSPIYSSFQVESSSRNLYTVTIRDLSAPGANGCTCPDYLVNQLGTCKHIEAVFLFLRETERNAFRKASLTPPPIAYVYLHYGEEVSIEARRPRRPAPRVAQLIDSHFDYRGRFRGDPITHFDEFEEDLAELPPNDRSALKVAAEVREYVKHQQELRRRSLERARVITAVENGRVDFSPLQEDLYPFQVRGSLFLAYSQRGFLADEMGLGKTVQALAAATYMRERQNIKRCLIICPASLKRQWKMEIERFTTEHATVIEGSDRQSLYPRITTFFNVISYEIIPRDTELLKTFNPDLVILDEAQRIKNWRTRTAQAVKEIPKKYAFVLTGQPIESDLEAVYSIVQFLDQRMLGPLWRYYEQYFRFDGRGRHIGYRNIGDLKNRISSLYLRRSKKEVSSELPDLIENSYAVDLGTDARSIYDNARQKALALLELASVAQLDMDQRRNLDDAIKTMRRADTIGLDTREPLHSPKISELRSIIQDSVLVSSRKAIVFAEHQDLTRAVSALLDDLDVSHVHFHAGVPKDKQPDLVAQFTTDPSCRIFVATDLGSIGLNLQVADIIINLDQPWSASRRNQRLGRIYRLGRGEPVHIINLVHDSTVEESIPLVTGIDRTLLSRYAEHDPSKGPMSLEFETKNRRIREALSELLIAPPRRLPKRPTPEVKAPKKPLTPSLFDDLVLAESTPIPAQEPKAASPRLPRDDWDKPLKSALGSSYLGALKVGDKRYVVVDDPNLHSNRVMSIVKNPDRVVVVGPNCAVEEVEEAQIAPALRQLRIAQSLLNAGFPREALQRACLALDHYLGGSRGSQSLSDRLMNQMSDGQMTWSAGAPLALMIVASQSFESQLDPKIVRESLQHFGEILGETDQVS